MLIHFNEIPEQRLPNFKGGDGAVTMRGYTDKDTKIMQIHVLPGSSVGLHTHEGNCEVVYILSGHAAAYCNGAEEQLEPGCCHYCPMGENHTIVNNGTEDLVIFAVVPEVGRG